MKIKTKEIRAVLLEDEEGRKYVLHETELYRRNGEKVDKRKKKV